MTYKKMGIISLIISLCLLLIIGTATVVIDPYFHYHKPFDWQAYFLYNQRYQNDGIARHFDYNAIITGTSMTENFKVTECDQLLGVNSIKIPYSGATFKEINDALTRAVKRNPDIQIIVRSLDHYRFIDDKDNMTYNDYPKYLYDDYFYNDVGYFFNKDILLNDVYPNVVSALKGNMSTTFDEYSNWNDNYTFSKEQVLSTYERASKNDSIKPFTEADKKTVQDNVSQNIISLAKDNPQIDFYFFLPAYSMVYWDSLCNKGELQFHLEAQKVAIEMILEYDNIHLFSFLTDYEIACDLNNYKDDVHYNETINSRVLNCMKNGEYQLTKDNCEEYFNEVYDFYTIYNYDSIFE